MEFFLSGIPKLSRDEKIQLEKAISFEELSAAAKQQSSGRSPGLDGLFYKTFWSLIGPDLQCPPLILAPLINMSKGGCENKSAWFILLIFHSINSQNSNLSLK